MANNICSSQYQRCTRSCNNSASNHLCDVHATKTSPPEPPMQANLDHWDRCLALCRMLTCLPNHASSTLQELSGSLQIRSMQKTLYAYSKTRPATGACDDQRAVVGTESDAECDHCGTLPLPVVVNSDTNCKEHCNALLDYDINADDADYHPCTAQVRRRANLACPHTRMPSHPVVSDSAAILLHREKKSTRKSPCCSSGEHRWVRQLASKALMFFFLWQELVLSSVVAQGTMEICKKVRGLTPPQISMCQSRPDAMIPVSEGIQMAIAECRWQFRNNRWNCTSSGEKTIFGTELRKASKETAYEYAIKSAGILHSITTACGQGSLRDCGCYPRKGFYRAKRKSPKRRSPQHQVVDRDIRLWKWGGCSVDIDHGLNYSAEFMSAREIRKTERSLVNLHNYKVGRRVVTNNQKLVCRCHGVSGSCTMQTCWLTLPSFREVGNILLRKYHEAKRVVAIRGGSRGRAKFLKLRGENLVKPRYRDLVYLDESPRFCERDDRIGVLGTYGRQCDNSTTSSRSCQKLCCNRGFRTIEYTKQEHCDCKFFWCCKVTCKLCVRQVRNYTCY